jgi:hypothetical protein
MAGKIIANLISGLIFLIVLHVSPLSAQTWPSDAEDQEGDGTINQRYSDETLSPLPAAGRSLRDSVTQNPRNTLGFSLGLYGLYDSAGTFETSKSGPRKLEGMILPMVFANFGKRKTMLHLDYSMERRIFTSSDFDTTFHTGNVGFSYMPTRSLTINLFDEVRSAPSNLLSISGGFSPGLPGGNPVGPGISAYSFERLLMNNATGRVYYDLSRNNTVNFYGNFQIFRYESDRSSDMNPYNVGAGFTRAVSRKLNASIEFLAGNYDTLSRSRRERIKRLSGGITYQLSRNWSLFGKAGAERVEIQDFRYTPTFFEGGIGRATSKSVFAISYRRGAQYQLGTTLLTATHTASLSLDQRMSKRSSLLFTSHYYQSKPYSAGKLQTTFISGLGLKFLLIRYLIASANGSYIYQNSAFMPAPLQTLNRYIVHAGIEIVFPGVSGR